MALFHQSFMNYCQILRLVEIKGLRNQHVLFKPGSEASILYHKHEISRAKSLDQAFEMLYNGFLSSERRDGLLDMYNNLPFENFLEKSRIDKHAALRELSETTPMLQGQFGPA